VRQFLITQRTHVVWSLLLFASGALCGATAVVSYERLFPPPKAAQVDEFRQNYTEMMKSRLHLSPQQVVRLEAILDLTKAHVHELHQEYAPELQIIKDQQYRAVCSILSDSQRAEYDRIRAERLRRTGLK
jgi:hypothetical protein